MRNKGIAMNGPQSFYIKAVRSASKWGKKTLMNFAHSVSQKFRRIAFARTRLPPDPFLPFSVMVGFPMS